MIFKNKSNERVEPTFKSTSGRGGDAAISVSPDDRVVARPVASKRKSKTVKKPPAKRGASKKKKAKSTARSTVRSLVVGSVYWCFVLGIWGGIGVGGIVLYYGAQLPSASTWAVPDRPPNVKILANNGRLVANRGATGGAALGLHEMSPYIPQALVAIEDRRFYLHFGVDPIGLSRAMAANLSAGRLVQGGSTLTQQLAKNLFLTPERTVGRKVQEVLIALWLENRYSKDQILEMYLNRVFFGSNAYGVEAASRRYFKKSARDVSLQQAALLAGLVKAPSRLSPARNPQGAEERAQLVLGAMRAQGMVSDTEMTAALTRSTSRAAAYWDGSEHYVADAVMKELRQVVGDIGEDLIVDTTVDLSLQKIAEDSIRQLIAENGKAKRVTQGALVSIDRSGAVRALVGGYDYGDSQFDRATEAKRQPGSTFKPFVYLAALEKGALPTSVRNDAPVRFGNWSPENYARRYYGAVTLETALAKSLNSVAAQLIMEVGPRNVAETAKRLGITSEMRANGSLALGTSEVTPLELTSAYVPFATGGWKPKTHIVKRVTTMDGEVIYEARQEPVRVMGVDTAGMMNAMMSETVESGTARKTKFAHPAAGKTGTTQNSRDAWFIGYTANLVTGVWFGNDDGKPMKKVTGGSLPAQAWRTFMVAAHDGVPIADLPGYMPFNVLPRERPADLLVQRPQVNVDGSRAPRRNVLFPPAPVPDTTTTSSTTPRPQADVGGANGGESRTVLDIILNR